MGRDPNRPRRVAELIKRELAAIVQLQLKDVRARGATITAVEVTPDLALARVYFTTLAGAKQAQPVTEALNRAGGFMRRELTSRLAMRSVPQLRFCYDASVERGSELLELIERARAEDRRPGGG